MRPRSPRLPQPPSGLLQRLVELGQRLRRRTTPVWLLGASQDAARAWAEPRSVSPGARYGLGLGECHKLAAM
jgi:hypothetical protein